MSYEKLAQALTDVIVVRSIRSLYLEALGEGVALTDAHLQLLELGALAGMTETLRMLEEVEKI